jgi:transcriptional regulator with XRE-family HTH domain
MDEFASALRALRAARGLPGERAARRCGLSSGLLSRLEHGLRGPTPENLTKLAGGLAETPEEADRLWIAAGRIPPDLDAAAVVRACRDARRNARLEGWFPRPVAGLDG